MKKHFHRNGRTLILDGTVFYGIRESANVWVSPTGRLVTLRHPDGTYRGTKLRSGYMTTFVGRAIVPVHRVVYEVCSGYEIPDGLEIDHIDTVRDNNSLHNLRVVTRSENLRNPISLKRMCAVLSRSDVREKAESGRKRFRDSDMGKKQLEKCRENSVTARKRKIVCVLPSGSETMFESVQDAAEFLRVSSSSVCDGCRGRTKLVAGCRLSYKTGDQLI